MKLKQKIMTLLSLTALTAVLLVVGVWALKTINFTIDGNLSYVAPGVEATISKGTVANAEWQTASDAKTKMPQTEITNSDTETTLATKFSYWQNVNLNFNENGDDITITFSITNNSSSKYIVIGVSTSYASATNCTIAVDTTSTTLDPQASHTFTLTMAITDKSENATMTNFAVVFNMQLADSKPIDLKYDEDAGYYYVEMGTYSGSAVRWKLVGVDGERYTSTTKPTSGTGTFILETNLGAYKAFGSSEDEWENGNNDYSTSYIREYLTGNSSYALDWEGNPDNTDNGSFLTDFNIAEDDAVYSAITAREITDLHKDIGWAHGNVGGGQQHAPPAGTTTNATYDTTPKTTQGADKLWLMSVAEVYTMVGGGTIGADGTIPENWWTYYDNLIWNEEYYWLRSPDSFISYNAYFVADYGGCHYYSLGNTYAVRPAFNLILGGG